MSDCVCGCLYENECTCMSDGTSNESERQRNTKEGEWKKRVCFKAARGLTAFFSGSAAEGKE